jgi:plastocyanin
MNKIIIGVVVVLVIIGGVYYFVVNKSSGGPTTQLPTTTSAIPVSNSSPTTSATVSIQNFSFNPSTLSVKVGTKVTWMNNDTVPHTVTSDSGNLLTSPTLAPGQSFSFTFTTPGSVSYHCSIHPMMKGTISVAN